MAIPQPPLIQVPFGTDPLAVTATRILDHYADQLPDLSNCQILLAEERASAPMRAALLETAAARGYTALLGPRIERLDQWLERIVPAARRVLGRPAQELLLAGVLRDGVQIYADTDPWLLTDQLLTLFDELSRWSIPLAQDEAEFRAALEGAYGVREPLLSLEQEAGVLHLLWRAWRQQLEDDEVLDPAAAYHHQLLDSLEGVADQVLWWVGPTTLRPTELHWLLSLMRRGQLCLIVHGTSGKSGYHPDAPLSRLLGQLGIESADATLPRDALDELFDTVFSPSPDDLRQRATDFARRHPDDPVGTKLYTLPAANPEQEAQAVALQVRRWLLDDIAPIAIITEDRRLARRVRALLEASGISLDDPGGWALSTTSAAALLERWLETVEEDFACAPLLDVLKSPFISFFERESHLALVRRLEQDIILHENIARGLARYRHHVDLRSQRLPDWTEPTRLDLQQLLNRLDHAGSPLLEVHNGQYPAHQFIMALKASLAELGCAELLAEDAAGQQVLQLLETLQQAATHAPIELGWTEFRDWLGRNLERASFQTPVAASPVQLLTPQQSRLQRFPGIIMAGCNRTHLPGSPATETFFNQRVRATLGLPAWSDILSEKLHQFCRILHSGDRILLTWHCEKDGEPVAASPWLELLETFYRNAYAQDLRDHALAALVVRDDVRPTGTDLAALPPSQTRPRPTLCAALKPDTWSASTHQRLMDCPYRFFSADALSLKPQDEIREALSKSDYGSLVHRIVQAFNTEVTGLPGPWSGPLDANSKAPAMQLLDEISVRVFDDAIQDNFQARSWLRQWQAIMPAYLDWEIERRRTWPACQMEVAVTKDVAPGLRIKGRIDRIDSDPAQRALIDLKTGRVPKPEDVQSGEAVQLPSYALMLDEPVAQLEYLEISRDAIKTVNCADAAMLEQLLPATQQRLLALNEALAQAAALPAWGDASVCCWCEFDGVCRRDMWLQEESTP